MFLYISIFVAILLVLIIVGYFFLPNSQLSLTFSKKSFIVTVVTLTVILLYLIGFGIYDLIHPHQDIQMIHIDGDSSYLWQITKSIGETFFYVYK